MKKIFTLLFIFSITFLANAQCPTASAIPNVQTICSGQSTGITLTSDQSGTTYSWTCLQTDVSGAMDGTGDTIQQQLTATGTNLGTVTYTITPVANGCTGATITVTISVMPPPVATATPSTQTICSGETTNIALSSSIPGTTYVWNLVQSNCTGGNAGSGNVISQTLSVYGSSSNTGQAVYGVTSFANGCPGAWFQVDVIINPNPSPYLYDGVIGIEQGSGNVIQPYILDSQLNNANFDFVWYLNSSLIPGATDSTFEANVAGNYCVIATNTTTGCVSSLVCANVTTQTLSNSEFNTIKLTYSPNPVTDVLIIKSKEILKKVTVYNTLGQMVYSNTLNDLNPKIELSKIVSGNYFVKVEADNKQNVFQIIKK